MIPLSDTPFISPASEQSGPFSSSWSSSTTSSRSHSSLSPAACASAFSPTVASSLLSFFSSLPPFSLPPPSSLLSSSPSVPQSFLLLLSLFLPCYLLPFQARPSDTHSSSISPMALREGGNAKASRACRGGASSGTHRHCGGYDEREYRRCRGERRVAAGSFSVQGDGTWVFVILVSGRCAGIFSVI